MNQVQSLLKQQSAKKLAERRTPLIPVPSVAIDLLSRETPHAQQPALKSKTPRPKLEAKRKPSKSPLRSKSPFGEFLKPKVSISHPSQSIYRNMNSTLINYKVHERAKENIPVKQSVQAILTSALQKVPS
jgi:hypothetical protein